MMGVNESVDFRHNKEAFRRLFSNGNQGLKDPFLDFAWAANRCSRIERRAYQKEGMHYGSEGLIRWSLVSSVLQIESAISFRN